MDERVAGYTSGASSAHRFTNFSTSFARSFTVRFVTFRVLIARLTRLRVRHLSVPGISRSSPAFKLASIEDTPNQSLMTMPLKPHSSRRMRFKRKGFSETCVPLTRLYL